MEEIRNPEFSLKLRSVHGTDYWIAAARRITADRVNQIEPQFSAESSHLDN